MSTDRFFSSPHTIRRLHEGPLGGYIDDYAQRLQQQGYSRQFSRDQIRSVADLSHWLQRKRLGIDGIDPPRLVRYLRYRKRQGRSQHCDSLALDKLLGLLRERGIVEDEAVPIISGPRQRVLERFEQYLLAERGLCPATLLNYIPFVSQLLSERFGEDRIRFVALRAPDITGFVQRHAYQMSPGRVRLMVTALRGFLRYLRHCGEITMDLAACVPAVASWSRSTLPKFLPPSQVQRVLDGCDRGTVTGRRDYAILLLLARLGLRAGEVAALRLEDIDWAAGQFTVRAKGGRWTELPLPPDVGAAIAGYLQGRPRCASRRLFIRAHAPRIGFTNASGVCTLVKHALARAGVDSAHKGAHLFRHSLATQMLREGASLAEIGELLRHRHPNTTTIYAKVDVAALRALALPWPGERP
ncbi:MAG: hypothetical protein A3G25_12840 [Betaproteobacteria bacterium RIFCSPLOWO2_12_FULL_63_13]|nr:MAG: hypothetical protein A3G25_12840 [Betaproteobacteria bacterium RIFCSPLOWO2_12_FULL_63_13]